MRTVRNAFGLIQQRPQAIMRGNSSNATRKSLFDEATSILSVESIQTTNCLRATKCQLHVSDQYSTAGVPNGGYLMACAIEAAKSVVPPEHSSPVCVNIQFLAKADANEVATAEAHLLGQTKQASIVDVSVTQSGRTKYLATVRLGSNASAINSNFSNNALNHSRLKAPDLPPVENCVSADPRFRTHFKEGPVTNIDRFELRVPTTCPFYTGFLNHTTAEDAVIEGWGRLTDESSPAATTLSLPYLLDAFPPPAFTVHPAFWAPTLEYTVHFWNPPPPPPSPSTDEKYWLRVRFTIKYIKNGCFYSDGEVWSEDGSVLLGTSRQFARLLA